MVPGRVPGGYLQISNWSATRFVYLDIEPFKPPKFHRTHLNIIRYLSGKEWGTHPESLLNVYKGLIRSKLDYGASIYNNTTKVFLKKLDTIQNTAVRMSIKSTPIKAVLCDACIMPLEIHRKFITSKEVFKMYANKFPIMSTPRRQQSTRKLEDN